MTFPIDFGDDDAVVQLLLDAGAFEQQQRLQNIDVVVGIGSKLSSVMKQIVHGFMQEDSSCPPSSSIVATQTHVSHKLPRANPPVVYYAAPDEQEENDQHDFSITF